MQDLVDFHVVDGWREEDEALVAHPRDPFSRIELRRSSRRLRVEHEGGVNARTEVSEAILSETGIG